MWSRSYIDFPSYKTSSGEFLHFSSIHFFECLPAIFFFTAHYLERLKGWRNGENLFLNAGFHKIILFSEIISNSLKENKSLNFLNNNRNESNGSQSKLRISKIWFHECLQSKDYVCYLWKVRKKAKFLLFYIETNFGQKLPYISYHNIPFKYFLFN